MNHFRFFNGTPEATPNIQVRYGGAVQTPLVLPGALSPMSGTLMPNGLRYYESDTGPSSVMAIQLTVSNLGEGVADLVATTTIPDPGDQHIYEMGAVLTIGASGFRVDWWIFYVNGPIQGPFTSKFKSGEVHHS